MTDVRQCHWVKIGDEEWVHIPGCWGAIHDPAGCTCDIKGSELERALRARREAEICIEKLREKALERSERLNEMFMMNNRLRDEIRRLEDELNSKTP